MRQREKERREIKKAPLWSSKISRCLLRCVALRCVGDKPETRDRALNGA